MEPELIKPSTSNAGISEEWIPWLDSVTSAAVSDIAQSVIRRHPEVQAIILFGSVARHEERPLDAPNPSDVDLLLVLDAAAVDPGADRLTHTQELALRATIGEADYRHLSPREINVLFLDHHLVGWDRLFIENVAHDGILLWARGPLPASLVPDVQRRSPVGSQ